MLFEAFPRRPSQQNPSMHAVRSKEISYPKVIRLLVYYLSLATTGLSFRFLKAIFAISVGANANPASCAVERTPR